MCMPLSPRWSLLSRLPNHNFVCIYYFPYPIHLSFLSKLPLTSLNFTCCHLYEITMSLICDFVFCRVECKNFEHMDSCFTVYSEKRTWERGKTVIIFAIKSINQNGECHCDKFLKNLGVIKRSCNFAFYNKICSILRPASAKKKAVIFYVGFWFLENYIRITVQ
jgi:hypothetical protein